MPKRNSAEGLADLLGNLKPGARGNPADSNWETIKVFYEDLDPVAFHRQIVAQHPAAVLQYHTIEQAGTVSETDRRALRPGDWQWEEGGKHCSISCVLSPKSGLVSITFMNIGVIEPEAPADPAESD